ncbi:MAG: 5-methyltetrahydropteroyltriglutamate--homocysteine methyltransferase [Cocleimonas sp.]|jgi:5-methyltetrahydropteroyltriglutamate--homocysteine methyltransferase
MVTTHNLGLQKNKSRNQSEVKSAQTILKLQQQQETLDFISVGCTGVSDPMVTMMDLLGHRSEYKHFKAYKDAQWFGSEVRCVVPELTSKTRFTLDADFLIKEVHQAKQKNLDVKPIIIGPISYLWFSTAQGDVNKLDHLDLLLEVYADLLKALSDADIEWVQFDEPVLTQELNQDWKHALLQAYFHLQRSPVKKLIASSFGKLGDNLGLLRELTVDGVHLDTLSAEDEALKVADWLPSYKIVSVAVVDGRQCEETDIEDTLAWLKPIHELLGDRLWLAPSCSFLYMAQDDDNSTTLENTKQKLNEVKLLATVLEEEVSVERKAAA